MPNDNRDTGIDGNLTFQVPYLISDQPDGTLPDMQGFGLERAGSVEGGWYSLCPIKADRALAAGETVSACLVHRRSGNLTRFDYTAKAGKLGQKEWLTDFSKDVAAAGLPITAGAWSDRDAFSSSHEHPRLWCQADYRAFSTAPFDSNLVQVLACDDGFSLGRGNTLSLQVRDLKTQALHEQHLFTAKADSGWSKALCEQINRDSRLLRAGVKGAGCAVTPGEAKNAFWGPQCAELCVTLTEVNWWACRALDGTQAVPDGGVLYAWVYDTFSQRLLGHHPWAPTSTERAGGKWLKAWATALAKSAVADYLRVDTTTAMLEQRGDGLRIVARLPGDDYDVEGPLLASAFEAPEDAVLVTVRHPGNQSLLHHALFRPQASAAPLPSDEQSWLPALASFIEAQQWPELYIKDGRQLWLLRDAELQVALENVGDGQQWDTEDYRLELLSADEWPHDKTIDPVAFTVEPTEGLPGVTISSLDSELAFRLNTTARDKGYRVMACVPRQSAAKQLREAYISYVEATVKAGFPVALSFAEASTLTTVAAATAVVNAIPDDAANAANKATPRNWVVKGIVAVLGSTEFIDFFCSIAASKGYSDAKAAVYAAVYHAIHDPAAKVAAKAIAALKWFDNRDPDAYAHDYMHAYDAAANADAAYAYAVKAAAVMVYADVDADTDNHSYAAEAEAEAEAVARYAAEAAAQAAARYVYTPDAVDLSSFGDPIIQALSEARNPIFDALFDAVIDAHNYVHAVTTAKAAAKADAEAAVKAAVGAAQYAETYGGQYVAKAATAAAAANSAFNAAVEDAAADAAAVTAAIELIRAIEASHKEATAVWPVSVTDDTITWQGPLTDQMYDLYLDCPESERGKEALTVGHIGTLQTSQFWNDPKPVSFTPPKALKQNNEISFLCEDYGYTYRSELFDTTGHGEAGVDPRTGLFHAHYPVASLQGLLGQGPAVDLTLHYSALRANEAGLGDGWAWRFSNVELRSRVLTLADGAQFTFTDEQWAKLGKGEAIKLASCVVRSNPAYSEFTLDLPSGRQETLKKPAAPGGDEEEPNKSFHDQVLKTLIAIRDKSKPDFPANPEHWQQWVAVIFGTAPYYTAAQTDYAEAISTWHTDQNIIKLKALIADYQRPFVVLVPSTIESPYGETLTFEWKRQKGQIMLLAVKSGDESLFTAEYSTPQETAAQVKMQIWPQSKAERYKVELKLKDYLLRSITRIEWRADDGSDGNGRVLQQIDCDYDDDLALDRVLCGLRELDGSVERVKYVAEETQPSEKPTLPRVALHALVPGAGQENQVTTYRYEGDFLNTAQRVVSVEYESGAHRSRQQHVLVHGNVTHNGSINRFEVLSGSASAQGHWLNFCTRKNQKKKDRRRETKGYRYTGAGDEFAELLYALETGAKGGEVNVKEGAALVPHQEALLEWLIDKTNKADRPKLAACITRLLASYTPAERDALGRAVELATHVEDIAGNELYRHVDGEHTLYRCYYKEAGDNPFTVNKPDQAAQLKGIKRLEALPALSCPDIPQHASAPVMAEYQCDPFGNPQGLRLFGYREVTRGSRKLLELAEVLTIEGVKGDVNGSLFDASAGWALADDSARLLWRQRSTTATPPTREGSEDSKVRTWSVKDSQVTHEISDAGEGVFTLSNRQEFVDNPINGGILVRIKTTTQAGTQELCKELRSRHGRRLLEQVKQGKEVHWAYDALGRVTQETCYALKKDSKGLYLNKGKDQKPDEQTTTGYSDDGTLATHTHANKDISRTYLDGVQRAWRCEWRKNDTQQFVPLAQYSLQGLDASQLLASCEWDYLPGGQAVVDMTPAPSTVGPQAWVIEQGGLDRPAMRSMLQALHTGEQGNAAGAASDAAAFAPYATQDITSQYSIEEGLDEQCLYQRKIDYRYRKDGTFEQEERLVDGDGQIQLQLCKRFDNSGDIIGYERTLGAQTRSYGLERDGVGRVTRITRPDASVVEYSYHGLSTHATQLKVGGKVIAKQAVTHDSTLSSRTVGSREYSFTDDTVTLPDKSKLTVLRTAEGQRFKANEQTLSSLTETNGTQTQASPASDATMQCGWEQVQGSGSLPGRHWVEQTSPRAMRHGYRWLSLRGRPLASLRADGHWQRAFTDQQGRVLRTCQDHEEVVYRYDALGRLQSRQAQALKAGGQWWVLSEHDGFGQEVTRRFLYNGDECFKQCLTWRGDGRLASKTSYENGQQVRIERFTYDALDRLKRYDCEANAARHCPQDAQGNAIKAQEFTWDALSNLTRCVTTGFDGNAQTEELAYGSTSDPTRLTSITNGNNSRALTWNTNGYLTDAAGQHRFSYNASGQVDKVRDSAGNVLARYEYDGRRRLAAQYLKGDESTRELRYDGDELIGEIHYDKDDEVNRAISLSSGLAQYDGNEVRWLIDDPQVGIAGQVKGGTLELAPLLPFGEGTALEGLVSGYNGMRRDPLTGHYHAGNGYRSYDPALRRYAQPDWLSPFDAGGLNDYQHCPDPVNLHDPSGAIMLSRWGQKNQLESYDKALQDTQKMPVGNRFRSLVFSLTVAVIGIFMTVMTAGQSLMLAAFIVAMSVASFAFEVAAFITSESHPEVARWLSVASVVTGVLSCVGFVGVFKAGLKALLSLSKVVKAVGKVVWSAGKAAGRSAKAVWGSAKSMVRQGVRGIRSARRVRAFVNGPNGLGPTRGLGEVGGLIGPQNMGALGRFKYNSLDPTMQWLARQGLRGAVRQGWNHLGAPIEAAEQSSAKWANSGWLGKVGGFLTESIHTEGAARGTSYAIYSLNTALEANVLKGTIETSQSLVEEQLEEQQASVSIRGGSHERSAVPKLPFLGNLQHDILPAINSVRFW
ncbi:MULTISPECIES: RHS repeat-associated core domain-containing protein [Pseudomonas]|uniref:RHS repeat-associated core domain-containing protein n=1 Tax=Pseudomonas quercus TaxID=2722792 RepID=A0ABX0YAU0_9PSED|nr:MULTISPECIES: RHS repeat-associated core domain-containing protein [Pseudomonas]MBF7141546.1 hypothetical protein [Pseudomonas sp. LY10J]NJP00085.1 RHS repeat-associated core domain-containing protein [Pseudomonas quercus]